MKVQELFEKVSKIANRYSTYKVGFDENLVFITSDCDVFTSVLISHLVEELPYYLFTIKNNKILYVVV